MFNNIFAAWGGFEPPRGRPLPQQTYSGYIRPDSATMPTNSIIHYKIGLCQKKHRIIFIIII